MSSMNAILDSLKAQLKDKAQQDAPLKSIKRIIKGPAAQLPQFPIVTIVPVDEQPEGLFNSMLRVNKRIRIEVIQYKLDQRDAIESSNDLCNDLNQYFKVNDPLYILPFDDDSVLSSDIVNHTYSNTPIPFREGFIHISSFEVSYQVSEFPFSKLSSSSSYSDYREGDNKDLVTFIEGVYRSVLQPGGYLTGVKSLKSLTLGPHISFPVLFIAVEEELSTRAFTGKSLNERRFAINYISKDLDIEVSLEKNLQAIEKAKHVMFANSGWDGLVVNSEYLETVYGQLVSEGSVMLGSTLRFTTSSIEKI